MAVLAGLGVPPRRHDAPLHGPGARVEEQIGGQALGGELLLANVGVDPGRVEEHGVAADGPHDRDPPVHERLAEVPDLEDAGPDMVVVDRLGDPPGHCLEVAPGQAAVRRHPLEDHHLLARRLQDGLVVHGQEAADVHQAVFLDRKSVV